VTARPGIRKLIKKPKLLKEQAEDWRSIVPISGPLPENFGLISFGNEYFLSLGAHAPHHFLLMEHQASMPLTFGRTLDLVGLTSFLIDEPVVPAFDPAFETGEPGNSTRATGPQSTAPDSVVANFLETLSGVGELVQHAYDTVGWRGWSTYELELEEGWSRYWNYVDLPQSQRTWRLLSVYWHGLLATTPWARILNFWRVFEASIPGKENRIRFYENLGRTKPKRIPAFWRNSAGQTFDKMSPLRTQALRHRARLRRRHGSHRDGIRHLYDNRRTSVAHATTSAAEFDHLAEIRDLLEDAQLVRLLARISLEKAWR